MSIFDPPQAVQQPCTATGCGVKLMDQTTSIYNWSHDTPQVLYLDVNVNYVCFEYGELAGHY